MYETKVNNGFEVLEIEKGSWVEAIFAKEKPKVEKIRTRLEKEDLPSDDEDEDDDIDLPNNYDEEDDDSLDEEELTEESYRTTFDADPEELEMEGEAISDEDDAY